VTQARMEATSSCSRAGAPRDAGPSRAESQVAPSRDHPRQGVWRYAPTDLRQPKRGAKDAGEVAFTGKRIRRCRPRRIWRKSSSANRWSFSTARISPGGL